MESGVDMEEVDTEDMAIMDAEIPIKLLPVLLSVADLRAQLRVVPSQEKSFSK